MAKFKIDVDIDWLDEDVSLDDELKQAISNKIVGNVKEEIMEEIKVMAAKKAARSLDKWIDELITKVISNKIPYKSHEWDSKVEMISIDEMVTKKFEGALKQKVDEYGKPTNSSYDSVGTRLDWLTGKASEKYADKKVQEFVKDIRGDIERYTSSKVKEEMMKQLTANLVQNIDFNKVFRDEEHEQN